MMRMQFSSLSVRRHVQYNLLCLIALKIKIVFFIKRCLGSMAVERASERAALKFESAKQQSKSFHRKWDFLSSERPGAKFLSFTSPASPPASALSLVLSNMCSKEDSYYEMYRKFLRILSSLSHTLSSSLLSAERKKNHSRCRKTLWLRNEIMWMTHIQARRLCCLLHTEKEPRVRIECDVERSERYKYNKSREYISRIKVGGAII